MLKNISTIKNYYALAKIGWLNIFFEFLTLLIPALLSILTPVLLSNAITAITVFDFNNARMQIIYEFIVVVVSCIFYLLYHLLSAKISKLAIMHFHEYVYTNAKNNKNIKSINLATIKNISFCTTFNKNFLYKLCFLIKSIIILFIIMRYNRIIAAIIISVSIITFFLLKITDNKIKQKNRELSSNEQISIDLFNSIRQGESVEKNFSLQDSLKDKYFSYVHQNIKTTNSISLYYNINNNVISLILKSVVFFSTLYLISLIKSTTLTLQTYLILTPYLTSSAENLISFFDIFSEIALVENILNEFKALEYKEQPKPEQHIELASYSLYLFNLTVSDQLNNYSLKIPHKSLTLLVDSKNIRSSTIFKILNKQITPNSGSVFLDGKNISDISPEKFKKIMTATSSSDYFFNVSIFENLYLVCSNKHKIHETIKALHLKSLIDVLPEKLNTNINNINNNSLKFFLGISRSFLSGAKIINIYGIPKLSENELNVFQYMLTHISKTCTVICYAEKPYLNDIFDKVIFLDKLS